MDASDARVLVTGGAGFIGSHLTRTLIKRVAKVHVVDNLFAGRKDLVPDGVTFDGVDLRSDDLAETVRDFGPDAIVHLAAVHHVPYCNAHPEEAFDVNVMGTRNLLDAARDPDASPRIVFTSSAAVYPPRDGPNPEISEPGPIDVYGRTKLVGEDLLRLFASDSGASAVAARVFNVYGPNETNPHVIPAILDQVRDGNREIELGNLTPKRDFVHVSDVVEALVALLEAPVDGFRTYNVGTGTEHSVRDIVEHTSDALGEPIEIVQADDRVRESDRPHLRANISRIRREVGWEPSMELATGLDELLGYDQ